MQDVLITDFSDRFFQKAFKMYFGEFDIEVDDWDALFCEMNEKGENKAYIKIAEGGEVIGFIMFALEELSNWFFEEKIGFIREFWVSKEHRRFGYGADLLQLAESFFAANGHHKAVLTTDSAAGYYEARGYKKDISFIAKNDDDVYVKLLE